MVSLDSGGSVPDDPAATWTVKNTFIVMAEDANIANHRRRQSEPNTFKPIVLQRCAAEASSQSSTDASDRDVSDRDDRCMADLRLKQDSDLAEIDEQAVDQFGSLEAVCSNISEGVHESPPPRAGNADEHRRKNAPLEPGSPSGTPSGTDPKRVSFAPLTEVVHIQPANKQAIASSGYPAETLTSNSTGVSSSAGIVASEAATQSLSADVATGLGHSVSTSTAPGGESPPEEPRVPAMAAPVIHDGGSNAAAKIQLPSAAPVAASVSMSSVDPRISKERSDGSFGAFSDVSTEGGLGPTASSSSRRMTEDELGMQRLSDVVESVRAMLAANSALVVCAESKEGLRGWTVTGYVRREAFKVYRQQLLVMAQQALLRAAVASKTVYVLGYAANPFSPMPLGFGAAIADLADKDNVCWSSFLQGFCENPGRCQQQHPRCRVGVNVMLKPAKCKS